MIPARSALLTALLAAAPAASAATFTVSTLADGGPGSLREAIAQANASAGEPHLIQFQAGLAGSIVLGSEIRIGSSVHVRGPGAGVLAIDGNGATRLFRVQRQSGNPRTVTLSGLTLRRGRADDGGAIWANDDNLNLVAVTLSANVATNHGGAIWMTEADLGLDGVVVADNRASEVSGYGGGIYFTAGTATITRSFIAGNRAAFGGGMRLSSPRVNVVISDTLIQDNWADHTGGGAAINTVTSLRIANSTFFANSTGQPHGGGLELTVSNNLGDPGAIIENTTFSDNRSRHQSGRASALSLTGGNTVIRNSTFAYNKNGPTYSDPVGAGGALWVSGTATTVTIESTLFNHNTNGTSATPATDLSHASTSPQNPSTVHVRHSLFHTLPEAGAINGESVANRFATDAQLRPLAMHGGGLGFVPVHALARTSPAIDAGSNPGGLTTDQRGPGFVRAWSDPNQANTAAARPDIGAYEYGADRIFLGDFEPR